MLYFRKNGNGKIIEKYQVNFDKKEIEKIKEEIIDNCSFIKHIEYKSTSSTPIFIHKIIKNFTCTPIERDLCLYSYDEYEPPYLVELINQLVNGNSEVIDEILNYKIPNKSTLDDKINLLNQEFNKIAPENITKKKEKLRELKDLLKMKELNKNKQSIDLYYKKLVESIKFDFVNSLPTRELSVIESFLEMDLSNKVKVIDSKNKSSMKSLDNQKQFESFSNGSARIIFDNDWYVVDAKNFTNIVWIDSDEELIGLHVTELLGLLKEYSVNKRIYEGFSNAVVKKFTYQIKKKRNNL